MKSKIALAAMSTTMALTLLAACSSSKSTPPSAASAPGGSASSGAANSTTSLAQYEATPTTLPVTTPLSKAPPTGIKVDFLQNGQPPGQQFSAALKAAVKPLGWTESDINFDSSNPAAAGSAFQIAVNSGAQVIEVQGLDSALYAKFVPAAVAKHIIVVDDVTNGPEVPGVTYVLRSGVAGQPVAKIGIAAIQADAAQRKVTPHILFITSVLLKSVLQPEQDDIAAAVKASCSSCSFDAFNLSAQQTISNTVAAPVVSYLQTHRNINYLFIPNGAFAIGVLPAIKQAGLGTSIRLIGATPLPAQITDLKADNPQNLGWIADSIIVGAWMTIDAAARVLVGDDASVYADVPAPTWLLTNDSGPGLVPNPIAPVDYAAQYEKIWKVTS